MKKDKGEKMERVEGCVANTLFADCPYCGKENYEGDFGDDGIFELSGNEMTCRYCNKDFIIDIEEG